MWSWAGSWLRLLGIERFLIQIHAVLVNTILENDPHGNQMHIPLPGLLGSQITGGIRDNLNGHTLLLRYNLPFPANDIGFTISNSAKIARDLR